MRRDAQTHAINTGYSIRCCRTRDCQDAKKCSEPIGSRVADMLRAYSTLDSMTYTQNAVRIPHRGHIVDLAAIVVAGFRDATSASAAANTSASCSAGTTFILACPELHRFP